MTNKTKFILLLSCQIPSILCSLIIFYYFIRLKELRAKFHNHIVVILLIYNFLINSTELPLTLVYLYFDKLIPSNNSAICFLWIYLNYYLFTSTAWITAIASIQRYLMIYHRYLINNRKKHYIPILFVLIFLFIWYLCLIFAYPCEQYFDSSQLWCLSSCYIYEGLISTIDWIISSFIPVLLTTICNILLIIRVIVQKWKMLRSRTWRTTRKLTLQLFSIAFLFLIIYLPLILFGLIRIWFDPYFLFEFTMNYYAYGIYIVPILMPFVCLISLPEIIKCLRRFICRSNRLQPIQSQHFTMTVFSRRFHQ